MNRLAILAIPILLSGCGIPPAVSIASYAIDGAVWAASGKTVRDHALSAVVQQDCSMFRVISGNPVCTDYEPNDAAAVALESMPPSEEMLTTTSDGRVIRVAAAPSHDTTTDRPVVADISDQARQPESPSVPTAATNATPAPAERTLITTADGREIRVAATQSEWTEDDAVTVSPVRLSWVPPDLRDDESR